MAGLLVAVLSGGRCVVSRTGGVGVQDPRLGAVSRICAHRRVYWSTRPFLHQHNALRRADQKSGLEERTRAIFGLMQRIG